MIADEDTPALSRVTEVAPTAIPIPEPERIHAIDILRGIAVLGMILVHFHFYANDFHVAPSHARSLVESVISWTIWLLVETKAAAIFTFLFGVGFAIQLQRATARGGRFVSLYMRRLLALGLFGFVAHALFGFNILLSYAYAGLWLLVMRNWSPRALLIAAVVSATVPGVYATGRRVSDRVLFGSEQATVMAAARDAVAGERAAEVTSALEAAEDQPDYEATLRARLQQMRWFYVQLFFLLPGPTLTLMLLGLLAFRGRVFEAPHGWIRPILGAMAFGACGWAAARWLVPLWEESSGPWVVGDLRWGLGVANEQWLAFTYMGAFLLALIYRPRWIERGYAFGWVGRMALTNYLLQIALLDLLFAGYGLHLEIREMFVVPTTLLLFGGEAVFSRFWLQRFRFGPAEWLWRSLTYGRMQPLALVRQ